MAIEPAPTPRYQVSELEHNPGLPATPTVPQHIQEVHLRVQKRSIRAARQRHQRLNRRQGGPEVTTVSTIDVNGNPVVTTFTVGAVVPATSITPTSTAKESDTTSQSGSSPSSQNASNGNNTSTPSHTGGSVSSHSPASGGSATGNSQTLALTTSTDHNSTTHTPLHKSTGYTAPQTSQVSSVYLATLKNSHIATVTRSNKPYVTTFSDGEVSTICDLTRNCRIATQNNAASRRPLEQTSLASLSSPSTAYAAVPNTDTGTPTSPVSSSSTDTQQHNDNDTAPTAGTIAGGVVGGAAGLAVILLVALVFLRWYKRRSQLGHHALPPSSGISPEPDYPPSSRGPGMAERAGLTPLVTAVPGFFRHQNRSQDEPLGSERGFTKISGRKLPSAFSEGMSSGGRSGQPPDIPPRSPGRNLSSTSFYRDSHGFYGGEGAVTDRSISPEDGPATRDDYEEMTLSPGPQRRPTVHTGGPYVMSPSTSVPDTPNRPLVPGSPPETVHTFGRSSTPSTLPDNRSSRFTEEV